MKCDMCGANKEILYKTNVEGAVMSACQGCSKFGKVISKITQQVQETKNATHTSPKAKEPEIITIISRNAAETIKRAREKKGLKQEELAQKIGEKSSVIKHLEHGEMKPSLKLAEKLEKFLGIELIQEFEDKKTQMKRSETKAMTIGDLLSVK